MPEDIFNTHESSNIIVFVENTRKLGDYMYKLSLKENEINFKDLEKSIYKFVCRQACEMIVEILEKLDEKLMKERDKKKYRNKGFKKTTIKTVMGEIEYKRRIYEYKIEEGKKGYKHLLDEYLKMDTVGHISTNLVEKIINLAVDESYRKTADKVTEMTNQSISHSAAWNIVQTLGEKINEKEKREIKLNKEDKLQGEKETKVLFEEMDGIWINMQGKDRKSKKKGRKELKLGIFYEGWEKKHEKKDRYQVKNKKAYASFGGSKDFGNLREAKIAKEYKVDKIQTKIVNGDGAKWIKEVVKEDNAHFQLDIFHRNQAVFRNIENKRKAKKIIKKLSIGKIDEGLKIITNLMIENNQNEQKMKKLETLYNYIVNNREGIVVYKVRPDINIPKPPKGIKYRNLGTMEHNICDILARRMKGNKTSWSKKGASNLAKILAEKASKELSETMKILLNKGIRKEKLDEIIEKVVLPASKVNRKPKKSNIYKQRISSMPFSNCAVTNGRKAIQKMLENRCASELKLSF